MSRPFSLVCLLALSALFGLSGCSTFRAQPDPVGYYRLEARMLTPGANLYPQAVVEVNVPDIVDHKKLTLPQGSAVVISDFDRWVEPFGKGVERVLDLNVRALLGDRSTAWSGRCRVNILEVEARDGSLTLWMDYTWFLGNTQSSGAFSCSAYFPDTEPAGIAAAWSQALELSAQELINALPAAQ